MQKLLLVTEKPNTEALGLNHEQLFNISQNTFSQFFGRILLGREEDYKKYFIPNNFLWMHAKGSLCHGDKKNDGKKAIINRVISDKFSLIITFGAPALKVFFGDSIDIHKMTKRMQDGPKRLLDFKDLLINDLGENELQSQLTCFPHPSGENNQMWKEFAVEISQCIDKTQKIIFEILTK